MIAMKKPMIRDVVLGIVILSIVTGHALHAGAAERQGVVMEKNIVYGTGGDVDLKLDLARPERGTGPFPALVFLFGGSFKTGSKANWLFEMRKAAERGYVAIAINYRLTSEYTDDGKPKYPFPAQVHDGKCAIRWLRANAGTYAIDPNRIGVVGAGAGGNLALMVGLTDSSDGLEGDCGDTGISSRVQAIVNIAGSTDMWLYYQLHPIDTKDLLGGTPEQMPERYRAASPLTYVSQDDPPVLSICGTVDFMFPETELLDERMKAIGASHSLIAREGFGHAQVPELVKFAEDNPVWDFLDMHLKKETE